MLAASTVLGCASLGAAVDRGVRPPRFTTADDRRPELRLSLARDPGTGRASGVATVRLWARVENPNPFRLTLSSLDGTLFVDGRRAALVDLPLGIALSPSQPTVFPLDVTVRLADVPSLARDAVRAAKGGELPYRLDGSFGVDAGALGTPLFGPVTLLEGELSRE